MLCMAKIVASKNAPDKNFSVSLPGGDVEFGGKKSHSTTDRAVITEAEVHPWLDVDYGKAEEAEAVYRPDSVKPEDDVLSAATSQAFDPKAIKRDRDAVLEGSDGGGTAIDAGLDQGEKITEGGVAETIAADDADTKDKN